MTLRKLLAAVTAVAIVSSFVYLSYLGMLSAQQVGLQKEDAATISPSISSLSETPIAANGAAISDAKLPKLPSIESLRQSCIEEMKSTSTIALDTESHCAQYAESLEGQFDQVKPSQPYKPAAEKVIQVQEAQPSANISSEQNKMPAHAELVKRCGKRFDDINGDNLEELKRRYRNRQKSLVPADSEEMRELRCRIVLVSAAQ